MCQRTRYQPPCGNEIPKRWQNGGKSISEEIDFFKPATHPILCVRQNGKGWTKRWQNRGKHFSQIKKKISPISHISHSLFFIIISQKLYKTYGHTATPHKSHVNWQSVQETTHPLAKYPQEDMDTKKKIWTHPCTLPPIKRRKRKRRRTSSITAEIFCPPSLGNTYEVIINIYLIILRLLPRLDSMNLAHTITS